MAKKPPADAAWAPAPHEPPDTAAIQALARGEAAPHQQIHALKWIVEVAAGTYDQSYRPNSERESAFAEGRRFVGLQIVKQTKLITKRKEND